MPMRTLRIDRESRLHKTIVKEVSSRIKIAERRLTDKHDAWTRAEELVTAYVNETEDDAERRTSREAGDPRYTTIQVPYTYALLMAAHTYWTGVFLGRTPIHQYQGVNGEGENQTLAIESIINYQVTRGELLAPYYLWLYDTGKYGVGWLGTYWDEEFFSFTQMVEQGGRDLFVTQQMPGYVGNKTYNVSPYDALPDPRVPVNRFQEGEFFGVYRTVPWNQVVMREHQGYYMNVKHIKKTPTVRIGKGTEGHLERPDTVDMLGEGEEKHPAWIGVYEFYITLIPEEWGLGPMKLPEKWVFTVTSDFELCIQAQPLGLLHDKYPFDVLEAETEAYGLWNRGIPEIVEPLQNTMDWLVNTHFYNVRAIGNGRFVADPSKVDLAQLERGDAGWIVALRPEAWGTVTNLDQVFKQIQVNDPTANHMNDFERVFQIGERVTGINESILGAFGGGRRTAQEVRTTTGFGVNRLKTASEYMSATGFQRHSRKLVYNTQQFMTAERKVRIAGDSAQLAGHRFLQVTPELIAGEFDFVPVDGTLPIDRFAQATLWKDLLGQLRNMPQIMVQYDMGKIFAWVSQLAGLKNVEQFRVQVAPNEVLEAQAQAGNVVPIAGGPGPQTNSASPPSNNIS